MDGRNGVVLSLRVARKLLADLAPSPLPWRQPVILFRPHYLNVLYLLHSLEDIQTPPFTLSRTYDQSRQAQVCASCSLSKQVNIAPLQRRKADKNPQPPRSLSIAQTRKHHLAVGAFVFPELDVQDGALVLKGREDECFHRARLPFRPRIGERTSGR